MYDRKFCVCLCIYASFVEDVMSREGDNDGV
jgi:hypothetical protein